MRWLLLFMLWAPLQSQERFQEPWGKDHDLQMVVKKEKPAETTPSLAAKLANSVILFHQNFLSPTNGPRSHFRPSSSQYMKLAIQRYGFIKGYLMGCDRLLRENNDPWIYRTVEYDGVSYKFDPAREDKHLY